MMRDIVTDYIEEACMIADTIEPMSEYAYIFEASEGNTNAIAAENMIAQKEAKSKNILQKAIDAIKSAIEKLKSIVRNFIAKRKMSSEERAQYDEFCKQIKENPEFGNKKVSVLDWQAIEKNYKAVVNDIEIQIENVKRNEEACKPNILSSLEGRVGELVSTGRKATVQITLDQLVNKAKWDQNFAQDLQIALDTDSRALDALTAGMSKRDVNKAKRLINAYASQVSLRRLIMKARQNMMSVEKQAKKERLDAMKTLQKSLFKSKKYLSSEDKADAIDIYKRTAGELVGATMNDVKQIRNNKRAIKNINRAQKFAEQKEAKIAAIKSDPGREKRAERGGKVEAAKKALRKNKK